MSHDLDKARAEVARLELEAKTIPFTTDHVKEIGRIEDLSLATRLLRIYRDPFSDNGRGYASQTLDAITDRLTKLEETIAARDVPLCAGYRVDDTSPEAIACWKLLGVNGFRQSEDDYADRAESTIQPGKLWSLEDWRSNPKTDSFRDEHTGSAFARLLSLNPMIIDLAFGFDEDSVASPGRMAALAMVRDKLTAMISHEAIVQKDADTIRMLDEVNHALHVDVEIRDREIAKLQGVIEAYTDTIEHKMISREEHREIVAKKEEEIAKLKAAAENRRRDWEHSLKSLQTQHDDAMARLNAALDARKAGDE